MGGVISRWTSIGQMVALQFMQDNVDANQTDVQLPVVEVNGGAGNVVDEVCMPFDGQIVGISYDLSAPASAGQITIGATVNGTEKADTTQTITTAQRGGIAIPRGMATFQKGQYLGIEITTNAGWNANTADLLVTLWVLVHMDGV